MEIQVLLTRLDPIRISFTVRNAGGTPVQPDEDFFTQVALSKDLTFDDEDFVLKEFDLSGDALGSDLLREKPLPWIGFSNFRTMWMAISTFW